MLATHSFLGCFGTNVNQLGACEDDKNPCTVDTCDANGQPTHTPTADGNQCFLGANPGTCSAGTCELTCKTQMTPCKCSEKADCPSDNPCATWACTTGECVQTPLMDGMTVDPLESGDCKKRVCQGGALTIVEDATDTPVDVQGDCHKPVCSGDMPASSPDEQDPPPPAECATFTCNAEGTPLAANAAIGTKCGAMMDMACDKMGMCVACLPAGKDDYDKCKMNNGNVCPIKLCLGEMATNTADCASGVIADKVCCDAACTEECKSCVVSGMVGTCTNIPYYQTDPAYIDQFMNTATCDIASRCNGMGKCLKILGKGCTQDAECISGKCAMPAMLCLGAKGEACTNGANCVSGVCNAMGACD